MTTGVGLGMCAGAEEAETAEVAEARELGGDICSGKTLARAHADIACNTSMIMTQRGLETTEVHERKVLEASESRLCILGHATGHWSSEFHGTVQAAQVCQINPAPS